MKISMNLGFLSPSRSTLRIPRVLALAHHPSAPLLHFPIPSRAFRPHEGE